jgi:hypothetical protein
MKLRYYSTQFRVTAEYVREYADRMQISMAESKCVLESRTEPVLQYYVVEDDEWVTVPFVTDFN